LEAEPTQITLNSNYYFMEKLKYFKNNKLSRAVFLLCMIATSSLLTLHASKINAQKLPAIEIACNYITPAEGIDTAYARLLIFSGLIAMDSKLNINSPIQIQEITTTELWVNNKTQLYKISYDVFPVHSIVVIKDSTVLSIQFSNPTSPIFLADLDDDSKYEIYFNAFVGFGIISEDVFGYNIERREQYHLSMRLKKDIHLYVEQGVLMSVSRSYKSNRPHSKYSDPRRVLLKEVRELQIEE
jgi:hypothetical protein